MAITPAQYDLLVTAPVLQEALLDKDTATAMSAGVVTFYQDSQRTVLKNIYYQTNSSPPYSYIPAPNPNTLTNNGCLSDDNGNAILPFFFPYDELDDTQGQLYYITVVNAQDVPQFTLEGFPFLPDQIEPASLQQNLMNFMPNPQFAAHNNIPNNIYPNGTTAVVIAPGGSTGWSFAKPGSIDTDIVEFEYFTEGQPGLPGNPHWALNTQCTYTAAADAYKELRVVFDNVNRFASNTQSYTFAFWGLSTSGAVINVLLYKYYGSGGSTPTTTPLAQFTLTNPDAYEVYEVSFVFGSDEGTFTGPNNDDFFEIVLQYPSTTLYNASVTNFILTPGVVSFSTFPERPDNVVFADGIAGSMPTPDPNGMDLYLPIIYTPTGFNFDTSTIGNVYASLSSTPPTGYLYMDGTTYFANQYNAASGIPYKRLANFLYNGGSYGGIPLFGTGSAFVTAYSSSADTAGNMYISSNQAGTATPVVDGANPTGFTISTQLAGTSAGYNMFTQRQASTSIFLRCNTGNNGSPLANPGAGTSGFTVNTVINSALSNFSFQVSNITNAASLTNGANPGDYWIFSNTTTAYYVWYKISLETDPAPGGRTGILVQLVSTDTAADVTYKTLIALQAEWLSRVVANAASVKPLVGGEYFTFTANSVAYNVWYQVGGAGIAPVTGTNIMVAIQSTSTAAQIASATIAAINSFAFSVGDFRGLLLRGTDPSSFWDEGPFRCGLGNNNYSSGVGTFEIDTFQNHNHSASSNTNGVTNGNSWPVPGGARTDTSQTITIGYTGYEETRPVNAAVNWIIKY